ncbi:putative plant transposon protein domain [Dillenia turbinata]|uniref:Plant transposon protein domain n=1 Tax=Dillenia turbinata TaxID=194707 RepID=A0AAN8Z140_9MAGN
MPNTSKSKSPIRFAYGASLGDIYLGCLQFPNEFVYEKLVRVFYNNIQEIDGDKDEKVKIKARSNFCYYVRGDEIKITPKSFCQISDLPRVPCFECEKFLSGTQLENCQTLFSHLTMKTVNIRATDLGLHERILHLIVTCVIHPREGNYATITKEDCWLMACIMRKGNHGLHFLIPFFMVKAHKLEKQILPYGAITSEILNFSKVNLTQEKFVEVIAKVKPLFTKVDGRKKNGEWKRKHEMTERIEPQRMEGTSTVFGETIDEYLRNLRKT